MFVRCIVVVRFGEGPLNEVRLVPCVFYYSRLYSPIAYCTSLSVPPHRTRMLNVHVLGWQLELNIYTILEKSKVVIIFTYNRKCKLRYWFTYLVLPLYYRVEKKIYMVACSCLIHTGFKLSWLKQLGGFWFFVFFLACKLIGILV